MKSSNLFDFEQAIADWRRQMLTAGIKTPVPLEELESHLRDEIARQIQAGEDDCAAFELAARKMGQPGSLRAEFMKNAGLHEFLFRRRTLTIGLSLNRLVGLLWLVWSAPVLVGLCREMTARHEFEPKAWFLLLATAACAVGGVLLIAGSRLGRTMVRINALFWAIAPVEMYFLLNYFAGPGPDANHAGMSHVSFREMLTSPGGWIFALGLVSVLVLHLPEKANLKTTVRI